MDRLDLLTLFVAVADQRSFAQAARRVGRSPASVTRGIAALEAAHGARLFTRTTRALALTEAGTRLLEPARRVLAELAELDASLSGTRASLAGTLSVTAPLMFGRVHLLPVLQHFQTLHPGVRVNLILLDRIVSLVEEGIDLGLRIGHLPESSLQAVAVGTVRRVLCASPDYLAAFGTPATPADLTGHRLIAMSGSSAARDRWQFGGAGGRAEVSVAIQPHLAVNSVDTALDAAAAGGGITRVFSYQLAARPQGLVPLLADWSPPPVPIHLLHPAGRYTPPKVRAFLDLAVPALRGALRG